jgi:hypothetical protein
VAEWYMFVKVDNSTEEDNFDDWWALTDAMTPTDIDFARLEHEGTALREWALNRWGVEIGPHARVWEVSAMNEPGSWITHIMDRWSRG